MFAVLVFLGLLAFAGVLGALAGSWTIGGEIGPILGFIFAIILALCYMFKKD